jgi:hypothetical protein
MAVVVEGAGYIGVNAVVEKRGRPSPLPLLLPLLEMEAHPSPSEFAAERQLGVEQVEDVWERWLRCCWCWRRRTCFCCFSARRRSERRD